MIDIEKVRGHLGNLWGQTSMSDVGSKRELDKAISELERLQKKEVAMKAKVKKYIELSIEYNREAPKRTWNEIRDETTVILRELKDWSDEK